MKKNKIFRIIYAIICYTIAILFALDKATFVDAGNTFALIFVLLGFLLTEGE